jgi:hypothetical protein
VSRIDGIRDDEEVFSGRIGGALLSLGTSSRKKGRRGMARRPDTAGCIPTRKMDLFRVYIIVFSFRSIRRRTGVFGRQDRGLRMKL